MPSSLSVAKGPLKAVILAAGKDSGGRPLLLEKLGEHSILQLVVQNVLQVVAPQDIYVVVGQQQDAIRKHLGEDFQYVVQDKPQGTGHAVLQVRSRLTDFH